MMIDYTAFQDKDILKYNGKIKGLPKLASPFVGFILISIFIMPITFILLLIIAPWAIEKFSIFIFLAVLLAIYYSTRHGREMNIKTALFANRNGFSYNWHGGKMTKMVGLGSVLGEPNMSNVVKGKYLGHTFVLCNVYSDRGFKYVMQVKLPNNYPHIILDAKRNNFISTNLNKVFPNSKQLQLEGDFSNHFKLYSATDSIETLQILSPELMARMIDYSNRADIEILENTLTLICNRASRKKDTVQMLFEAVNQITKDMGKSSNNSRVTFNTESRIFENKNS